MMMMQTMQMTMLMTKILRIVLDSTTDLDLPPEMADTSNYCATLGHKVVKDTMVMVMQIMVMVIVDMMVILMVVMKTCFYFLFI